MTTIYISYDDKSPEDRAFANQLREWLHENNYATWMRQHDILPGSNEDDAIYAALKAADVIVGIMSPASVEDDDAKNEWAWALQHSRLILLERSQSRVPHRFIRLVRLDFSGNDPDQWEKLKSGITASLQAVAGNTEDANTSQSVANEELPQKPQQSTDFLTSAWRTFVRSWTGGIAAQNPPFTAQTTGPGSRPMRNWLIIIFVIIGVSCFLCFACSLALSSY